MLGCLTKEIYKYRLEKLKQTFVFMICLDGSSIACEYITLLFNLYVWPFKRICINGWTLFVYSQIYSYLENELESPNVFSDDDPRLVIINSEAYAGGRLLGLIYTIISIK